RIRQGSASAGLRSRRAPPGRGGPWRHAPVVGPRTEEMPEVVSRRSSAVLARRQDTRPGRWQDGRTARCGDGKTPPRLARSCQGRGVGGLLPRRQDHRLREWRNQGTVRLWDVETGRCRQRWPGHDGGTFALAFSPDGRRLASAGGDLRVCLRNTTTGEEVPA